MRNGWIYKPRPSMVWTAGLLAITATFVFIAAAWLYRSEAPPILRRLDVSVGEVLMKVGEQLETAGLEREAREQYQLALQARFEGPQNYTHTLERLGTLMWRAKEYEEARNLLEATLARPRHSIEVYHPLVASLYALDRLERAAQLAGEWVQDAEAPADASLAHYYVGQVAEARGEAGAALAAYRASAEADPAGPGQLARARLQYEREAYDEALGAINAFLRAGQAGPTAKEARTLRQKILLAR